MPGLELNVEDRSSTSSNVAKTSFNGSVAVRTASVVIATYCRGEVLLNTIEDLVKCDSVFELVIVDQTPAHEKETAARLASLVRQHSIKYLKLSTPNLPLARNVGIRNTTGDIVIFCDDDVAMKPDYVANHLNAYADPSVGAVAGRVISPGGMATQSVGPVGRVYSDGSTTGNFDFTERCECDAGIGCNMSFRRSVLVTAGGFDERYTGSAYREETDTFLRIKRAGYRVVFEPDAGLTHLFALAGGCRADIEKKRQYTFLRNDTLLFLKCCPKSSAFSFLYKMSRRVWALVKVENYAYWYVAYFMCGTVEALAVFLFQHPQRLSRKLADGR